MRARRVVWVASALLSLSLTHTHARTHLRTRANTPGPIFYMRKKVQKDLKDATEELARFQINW